MTTTYCLRYANYPLDLKGFKNGNRLASLSSDPEALRKSIITVITILILESMYYLLAYKFLSFIYLQNILSNYYNTAFIISLCVNIPTLFPPLLQIKKPRHREVSIDF